MRTACLSILLVLPFAISGPALAEDPADEGPRHRVLVELFTSQGWSSCPRAEEFLADIAGPKLGDKTVILAWHVDYWDYLGWKDPFGSKVHTKRQKAYVKKLGARGLMTPQLLVENKQASRSYPETILAEAKKPARVLIIAGLEVVERKLIAKIRLEKPCEGFPENAVVLPVLFQKKVVTEVAAGENEGKTLTEHFVVRNTVGPFPATRALDGTLTVELELPEGVAKEDLGFAVLVEDPVAMITLESAAYDL